MAKLTAEMRILDSADWQELLTIMLPHLDELPAPVQQGLEALSNGEALVWDSDWVLKQCLCPSRVTVVADGLTVDACRRVLPIRRGYVADEGEFVPAHTLSIMHKGKVLAGW
jgi:hypothetical protein